MRPRFCVLFVLAGILAGQNALAQGQGGSDFFAAPLAKVHYAPDRDYNLIHVDVHLTVDWPHRSFAGYVVDTLTPLRRTLDSITLDAGKDLKIHSVEIDGRSVSFKHDGAKLVVQSGPISHGENVHVKVAYDCASAVGRGFGQGGEGGWHWIQQRIGEPNRIGFWTQGETDYNHNWIPLWDYPNDFVTSETHTTVPADWTVISNGEMVSDKIDEGGKTRTFYWRNSIPHATYLISLCGGPFDVAHDTWRGVPLYYVVPKGEGKLIPESFGHTKDMLSFYSDAVGYKFPWAKYAQDAMFDFGGGMENASATTLGEGSLTDPRAGYFNMDSLNSHEMGHQWFGDTVTCEDWGQTWLNESFATYMQMMYFEHSRGANAYDREIERASQGYFTEAQNYRRPIATNLYANPDNMFDQHSYPKGAVVLHTLRHFLGDYAFFEGLNRYLETHQHTPVETNDLCEAMTNASGINCQPFFNQWVYKPGHPVIDSTWTWDANAHQVVVHVAQQQDTSDGTPIYNVRTAIGFIDGAHVEDSPIELTQKVEDFRIARATKPDAVLFDPHHVFLRQIPSYHWSAAELPFILKSAPSAEDRARAMRMMLDGTPSDETISTVINVLKSDQSRFPAIESYFPLVLLAKESARSLYEQDLHHPNFTRRAQAVMGISTLPQSAEAVQELRAQITDEAPYVVISESLSGLAKWDIDGNLDMFARAGSMPSLRNQVQSRAFTLLARSHSAKALDLLISEAATEKPVETRVAALNAMAELQASEPKSEGALKTALSSHSPSVLYAALQTISSRHDKDLKAEVLALAQRENLPERDLLEPYIQGVVKNLE